MEENVYDVKFDNIDKCIGRLDEKMEDHEKRIQESELARKEIYTTIGVQTKNIDKLTNVLWFVGSAILLSIIASLMSMILKG